MVKMEAKTCFLVSCFSGVWIQTKQWRDSREHHHLCLVSTIHDFEALLPRSTTANALSSYDNGLEKNHKQLFRLQAHVHPTVH